MKDAEKNVIKIVMTSDNNYVLQSKVTLWSMLCSSSKAYFYEVNVLCSSELQQEYRDKMLALEKVFSNIKISFVEIGEELFKTAVTTSFYTLASYYRLVIPEVISGDKCLFLDGDMIIHTDISKLYEIEIDNYLLAAVLDAGVLNAPEVFEEHKHIIDITGLDQYVNAGVMLWNLKKMRQMNLTNVFMGYIGNGFPFMDNDILNKCCYGNILLLDTKYNFFPEFYNKPEKISLSNINRDSFMSVDENDVIVHYAGKHKPWNMLRANAAGLWWNTAKDALELEDFDTLREKAEWIAQITDWSEILRRSQGAQNVIVFGFSEIGMKVCSMLRTQGVNVSAFCDNSLEKQKLKYEGICVLPVHFLIKEFPEALWVVTSQNYHAPIISQLLNEGILKKNILRYLVKDSYYYRQLDKEYEDYEQEEKNLEEAK